MTVTGLAVAAQATADAYTLGSLTNGYSSDAWDWAAQQGKTVQIASNGVAPMNDYTRSGTSRFGTPAEIDNNVQEIVCARDRSFTFTVDKMGRTERAMTIEAGKQLRKQIDEVVTPEIDAYTFAQLHSQAQAANKVTAAALVTKSNAYENFLALNEILDGEKVPAVGRVAWCTPAFYNMLKQDPSFTKASETTMEMLVSGVMGEVDGVAIVKAPASYMPANSNLLCVLAHKDAWIQPVRLEDYRTHIDPPGISGWLVEGRVVYDVKVLERLADGAVKKNGVATLAQYSA